VALPKFRLFIQGAVSVAFLGFFVSLLDAGEVVDLMHSADIYYLGLAFAVILPVPLLAAGRWRSILLCCFEVAPFFLALRGSSLAFVLNCFTPSKGGDLAKAL